MDTKIQPVIPQRKRGLYRQHSTEFKRAVVARSFAEGASVARLARGFNINANQVFNRRRQTQLNMIDDLERWLRGMLEKL